MVERKYEFTGETIEPSGTVALHRIRAVRDFDDIKAGDVGGWIESEHNLSHSGDCWVYVNSVVREYGQARGNAKIKTDSYVWGSARVIDHAQIEHSQLSQHALIKGVTQICRSRIGNYAHIEGSVVKGVDIEVPCYIRYGHIGSSRDLLTIGPIGSEDGTLTAYRTKVGDILVTRGCFIGSLTEFMEAVERHHGDNRHGQAYRGAIDFIRSYFEVGQA